MLEPKKPGRAPAAGKVKPSPAPMTSAILNPAVAAAEPILPVELITQAEALPDAPVAAQPTPTPTPTAVPATAPAALAAPAARTLSNPVSEGQTIMATTFETATNSAANPMDKLQSMFGDTQGRTKAAMEKGAKFYEEMGDFTKGNVEAVMASTKLAASGMETLGQDVAAYGKRSLEHATTTFKSLSAVKSPTDLFQLQSDYAKAAFDAMVAEGSKMSEKLVKLAGEVSQPLSTRFAMAAEKLKTPAL